MEQGNLNKFKVVFVGNISVGKTSILNRYVSGSFVEEYQPTVGIDFVTKSIPLKEKGVTLQLQLWDTAGQERFHTVIPIYIRDSSIAVIVFDVTDAQSFESVHKWVDEIKTIRNDESDILLIGNKCDLKDSRKITTEEAQKKCTGLNLKGYYEVSAKNGDGIPECFDSILSLLSGKLQNVKKEEKVEVRAALTEPKKPTGKCAC